MKRFYSGKTYTHATGHSCAFRQWKADSHCNLIHGYALQFEFTFGGDELDERNWIVDFGGLKELKQWLKDNFDHKFAVAKDDPALQEFLGLEQKGLADVVVMNGVGCEKFAEQAYHFANDLVQKQTNGRCYATQCEVREHGANSAIYKAV